jgi:DNA polymerase (family X)
MTNKDIANKFKLLADLMELYNENSFKIKSYANAYLALRKYDKDLNLAFSHEIESIPGIGKAVAEKISELLNTDKIEQLENLLKKTPEGIIQMLNVRGLGPKKVKAIWSDLKVEDISELLLACNENRLVEVKGFGYKTQEEIKHKIEFFLSNSGKFHYASIAPIAEQLVEKLRLKYPTHIFELNGLLRRKMPIVDQIDLLTTADLVTLRNEIEFEEEDDLIKYQGVKIVIENVAMERLGNRLFEGSCSESFLSELKYDSKINFSSEIKVFESFKLNVIPPAFRENKNAIDLFTENSNYRLIELEDIKGVVHNHSTYSDGLNSIKEMADVCIKKGYEYFVISDHSVSAFYAKGMSVDRVYQQWKEIDALNKTYKNFKIYKGIEADILNDGRLDYPDEVLEGFDVVIASIHSNLKMDEDKATSRLVKAIENKYTDILGHPTGRLLLGRSGYPIDHKKIIDACAANDVTIELNANPQRLDLDWKWIPYALEKEVKISINPDAHSISQIDYIKYGVYAASKGGLTPTNCLNTLSLEAFENWVKR